MSCSLPVLVTVNDGTTTLSVHGHAFAAGGVDRAPITSGYGEIEYADGSAALWVRFERRAYTVRGFGPAPSGLWDLDITAASWAVTLPNPDSYPGASIAFDAVPARPSDSWDRKTAKTTWSIVFRTAAWEILQ